MTGRGIDQVLPHPNDPRLHELYIGDARSYVELAERVNGAIPRPVEFDYIWGDALVELDPCRRRSAHHQSRDERHFQQGLLARQGDPLPHASAQHQLHYRGGHRLLLPREQPCPTLGMTV